MLGLISSLSISFSVNRRLVVEGVTFQQPSVNKGERYPLPVQDLLHKETAKL